MQLFYFAFTLAAFIFFFMPCMSAQASVQDTIRIHEVDGNSYLWPIHALHEQSAQDDIGQIVQLPLPAKRIISLAPNLTEILFAIGAGKAVVGISSGTNYPAAAVHIPIVANYSHINIEAVLALHPDLVVAWQGGNPISELSRLRQLGIPIYIATFKEIEDISHTMANLAVLTGNQKNAAPIVNQITEGFSELKKKYANRAPVTVFYQIWQRPLFTISRHSFINQVIRLCGGLNIFATIPGKAPQVSQEEVLADEPSAIVASEDDLNWQQPWLKWRMLAAVRYNNLFKISPDLIARPGPRLLQGAQLMCKDLELARVKMATHFANNQQSLKKPDEF